jgi:hypothetical protein
MKSFESSALYHIIGLTRWTKLAKYNFNIVPDEILSQVPNDLLEDFHPDKKEIDQLD